jgi:cytoskeletal protein RodZ
VISYLSRVALAVVVIIGWLGALLWLSFSVAQIAVEHTTTTTVRAHCLPAGETPCRH